MNIPPELLDHLTQRLGLDAREARRAIEEVLAFYAEDAETFVRRRHRELQHEGWKNDAIFARLREELGAHRFPGPSLTARQLRRWIYG